MQKMPLLQKPKWAIKLKHVLLGGALCIFGTTTLPAFSYDACNKICGCIVVGPPTDQRCDTPQDKKDTVCQGTNTPLKCSQYCVLRSPRASQPCK